MPLGSGAGDGRAAGTGEAARRARRADRVGAFRAYRKTTSSVSGQEGAFRRMDNLIQQLINGLTLGSIYGLIAIGYTMVFGIIGMINFAHGDLFMLSCFIALLLFLALTQLLGLTYLPLAFLIVLVAGMILTSLWNWTIERIAY